MLDLASGASTDLQVRGHQPAWSRNGAQIAFIGDGSSIRVMNPGGTGVRTVAGSPNSYAFGIDWSPDSQWIVARNSSRGRLEIINAGTGESVPIPSTQGFNGPSWKP
jgi:Tol biopolymer transport system component